MTSLSKRWLLGLATLLALVLTACSTPKAPEPTASDNPVVALDGFQAQIEMSKVDLQPLSFWKPPMTTQCSKAAPAMPEVAYAQIVVPMLAYDNGHLVPYLDVFWMPRDWNHQLALYAHGYLPPSYTLKDVANEIVGSAPDSDLMTARDLLLCQGYALGLSTYSKQGYAVREGVIDTHLLNAVFRFIFWRRPTKTFVFGSSLGGLITLELAEKFSDTYAGAMPTCGPVGGSLLQMNYVGNVRLLFDTYMRDAEGASYLGGSLLDPGPTLDQQTFLQAILAAASENPAGFNTMVQTRLGIEAVAPGLGGHTYAPPVSLPLLQTPAAYGDATTGKTAFFGLYSMLRSLTYDVVGAQDIYDRANGWPFDNRFTTYLNTAALGPATIAPDPSAIDYYGRWYEPTGSARSLIPVLSLHTFIDPDVPVAHELVYEQRAKAGNGLVDLKAFVVPPTDRMPDDAAALATALGLAGSPIEPATPADWPSSEVGHCNFSPEDLVSAFGALVYRAQYDEWPMAFPADFTPLDEKLGVAVK